MLAGDWAQRIEQELEDPDRLAATADELAADPDVSDWERQALLDRIAQYTGDARKADPDDVDDEDDADS